MNKGKSVITILLGILAILLCPPVRSAAAGVMDMEWDVSLTISYMAEGTPLAGAEFDLYLAATTDEYGELTVAETFAEFPVDIRGENDDAWKALASTLEGYVLQEEIEPDMSGVTDAGGILSFPDQGEEPVRGLYLVLGHRHIQDRVVYDAAPFMVLLPGRDSETDEWIYDATVSPKYDSYSDPDSLTSRRVLKVWKDDGHEKQRPKEVVVYLLQDGKVFDTVTLNTENNWRYSWENLDNRYSWTVSEKDPGEYTVTVTREGDTFVVTNTYGRDIPGEPEDPTLPQTGQLWWPALILLSGGLLFVIAGVIRRRRSTDEES